MCIRDRLIGLLSGLLILGWTRLSKSWLATLCPLWSLDHFLPSRRHVPSQCSLLYRRCHWGYCRIVLEMIREAISVTESGWMQLSYRRDRFQLALHVELSRGFFFLSSFSFHFCSTRFRVVARLCALGLLDHALLCRHHVRSQWIIYPGNYGYPAKSNV